MKLNDHQMCCPGCIDDSQIVVSIQAEALLTDEGSEDVGSHEWSSESPCRCKGCGFTAVVSAFQWDVDEKGEVDLQPGDEVTFEVVLCAMGRDEDENYTLMNGGERVSFSHYDAETRRLVERTGVIDVIEELEEATYDEAYRASREMFKRHPTASFEEL